MRTYTPDRWVLLKITKADGEIHYRVFGCWFGGYLGSDSWKLNSGVVSYRSEGSDHIFIGETGSCYICDKESYGTHLFGESILMGFIEHAKNDGAEMLVLEAQDSYSHLEWKKVLH
jgi:hypothetical protein